MNNIENIIEDEILPVFNSYETYIDTNNGILNDELIQREKNRFFIDSIKYIRDQVVNVKQHYPEDNLSKVEIETEFYVISKESFENLKKEIYELSKTRI